MACGLNRLRAIITAPKFFQDKLLGLCLDSSFFFNASSFWDKLLRHSVRVFPVVGGLKRAHIPLSRLYPHPVGILAFPSVNVTVTSGRGGHGLQEGGGIPAAHEEDRGYVALQQIQDHAGAERVPAHLPG